MNNQMQESEMASLLEKLAEKLGTTSEYLWVVLLKQAPIDGIITLVQIGMFVVYAFVLLRLTRVVHEKVKEGDWEDISYMPIAAGWVILFFGSMVSVLYIGHVVTSFVNPEYWALNEILNTIKSK